MRRRGFFAVLLALPALLKVKEADPCIRIKEIRVDAKGHVLEVQPGTWATSKR